MPTYGARPLKRAIQKYLEDPMAEVLIKANLKEGDSINVGFNSAKSEIKIKIQKKKTELPEPLPPDLITELHRVSQSNTVKSIIYCATQ